MRLEKRREERKNQQRASHASWTLGHAVKGGTEGTDEAAKLPFLHKEFPLSNIDFALAVAILF